MKMIFISILFLFTLASCGNQDNSTELKNKEWHLQIIEDVAGLPAGAHQVPKDEHFVLMLSDSGATGVADCNTFKGSYRLDGEKISFSNFAVTEMSCPNDSLAAVFLKALSSAQKYSLKNEMLRIRYGNDQQLVFKQK